MSGLDKEFNEWWDSCTEAKDNPFSPETPMFWAWEGWQAAVKAERNRTWTQDHWTEYEHSIAAEEREACAKLMGELTCMGNAKECFEVAATYIRARGQQENG
jgi:DNA-binding PucR family transcriptional regulator